MGTFEDEVGNAFGYLERDFGYRITARSSDLITYGGNGVVVAVGYDSQRSYEVSVDLGEEGKGHPRFDLGEALRSCDAPKNLPSAYQVSDRVDLPRFLGDLAKNLRQYCSELLRGDQQAFERLQRLQEIECEKFGQERDLRYARNRAAQAWAVKDYERVISALAPHEGALSESEEMKLTFARKKRAEAG